MDERQLEALRQEDWDDICPRVLRATLILAARYGWNASRCLPKGKTVEDLVIEAIADLFAHPERRKPEVSLVTQLRNMVRSKLWNLAESPDEDVERSETLGETALSAEDGPAEKGETNDLFEHAIELLEQHPKVKGKNDHELVLLAFADGADPEDVAQLVEVTGLARERIYQVRREFRDIYPEIARQLGKCGGPHESIR